MKINRLETHDRLLHFKQDQIKIILEGLDDCLKRNPTSLSLQKRSPYIYIFAFPQTCDDGVTKKMRFQPRLRKPPPQTNSYLFRAISHTDSLEICWMLPPEEMWKQYKKGNVTESDVVLWSIDQYVNHLNTLARDMEGDFTKDQVDNILLEIARELEEEAKSRKAKQAILEAFSSS